ncbi:MAG: SpoIIE family protein phosphatase, partial [Chitinivibrionales bacterium]|nr:SpoIIE family protein phosphatase [Chitinivibrionales bacterium]
GKTTFVTSDLKRESYRLGEGIVGIVAKSVQALELDRGHDRIEMRNLGLNPHNIRNVLAVPLRIRENVLGVLVVQNRKHKSSFSGDDTRLLEALTEQAAISINNARIYEELARTHRIRQEMSIATDIQKQLLPRDVPDAVHLQVHPFIRPAKEVGGDYYDFIESGPDKHAIVIGDVSGKGLPAGMIMVIARTTLQIVARRNTDVKDVLTRFAQEMYPRMRRGQFMTLNFLLWDDNARTLCYSAAGHEHILWYRAKRQKSERIKAGGVAVGLLEDPSGFVSESCLQTEPGDVIVLYTDGMTEARNASEEMFTLNRLQDSLDRHAPLGDSKVVSEQIIADVTEFTGDAEQYDDITLLVATVK